MRNQFDVAMARLHTLMVETGALCESGIANAVKALMEQNTANARRAIELEETVNQREREIEQLCYSLLLRQQPVAKDLRMVSASLKMITDLERISDQAADIAEIALLGKLQDSACLGIIRKMSIACIGMVTDCIDAYVNQDVELAHKLIGDDDLVDGCFDEARRELCEGIAQNPEMTEGFIDLLMAAKYLERIADHAVNIGEWVIFIESSQLPPTDEK